MPNCRLSTKSRSYVNRLNLWNIWSLSLKANSEYKNHSFAYKRINIKKKIIKFSIRRKWIWINCWINLPLWPRDKGLNRKNLQNFEENQRFQSVNMIRCYLFFQAKIIKIHSKISHKKCKPTNNSVQSWDLIIQAIHLEFLHLKRQPF